jgi:hypothetical protein
MESQEDTFWSRLPIEEKFGIGLGCLGCENMKKLKRVSKRNNFRIKHRLEKLEKNIG